MTDREKWLQERRTGIGSSDAAAILGLSPWKSAMDVWNDKMGYADAHPDPDREFMLDLGIQLEPVIAGIYQRKTQRTLVVSNPLRLTHPDFPIIACTPDRLVKDEYRGVELKSENQFADQFGEPETDEVPYHYLIQCAMCLAVTRFKVWDVALLHGGAAFSIYHIERDLQLEKDMIDQLRAWWDKHIVGKTPPDVDGGTGWKIYLRHKFPVDILPITDAEADTMELIENLAYTREHIEQSENLEVYLENRLKFIIGDHEGLRGEFGKITWKKTKDRTDVDWHSAFLLATERKPPKAIEKILKQCTEIRPGTRRFLFSEKEGWKKDGDRSERQIAGDAPAPALLGNGGVGGSGPSGGVNQGALSVGGKKPARPGRGTRGAS